MTDFGGFDAERVASGVLRALPDVALIVFTAELRVAAAHGEVPTPDGVGAAEIAGRHVSEALAPEHLQRCERLFKAALSGRSASAEIETAGRGRACRVHVEPLPGSGGGICVWRDVTERRELLEELEQRARL